MSMNRRSTMETFWKHFEHGEIDRIVAELVTTDVEFVMPGAPRLRGAAQVRKLWEAWRAAFPDMRHETVHAIEDGDTYAAETRFAGTHTGTLHGARGEVPPTGRVVKWESADIVRFEGGKIASWRVYNDQIPFLAQLGLMDGP
jgi:predicted ester cyclase